MAYDVVSIALKLLPLVQLTLKLTILINILVSIALKLLPLVQLVQGAAAIGFGLIEFQSPSSSYH